MSLVAEQLLRLLHHCGMPASDVDLLHGSGLVMNKVMKEAAPRMTQFTGSQAVAERLILDMHGKVCGGGRRLAEWLMLDRRGQVWVSSGCGRG